MRVFVSDINTTLGASISRHLQDAEHEVLGSVPLKSLLATAKRKLLEHPSSDREDAAKEPVALQTDKISITKLLQKADVVIVTSMLPDTKPAMELLKLFEKVAATSNDGESEESGASGVLKRFIAISSVLAWSKNSVFANQKEQRGHSEDDFKTRKPARKYAELKTAETQILSATKPDLIETCVIASGLIYGGAQTSLAPIFRDAWMYPDRDLVVPTLPGAAVKRGDNLLPMISVYDLALFTSRVAVAPALPKPFMVAVDKSSQNTTLRDLCVGLSMLLGNGNIRDELTDDEVDQLLVSDEDLDGGEAGRLGALQLHLAFDSFSETSAMASLVPIEEYKHVETGLLSNLAFYVDDFIRSMDLRPLKTLVLGPPRAGKTTLSRRLAKEYYLPYLTLDAIVEEVLHINTTKSASAVQQDDGELPAESKPEDASEDEQDAQLRQLRVELMAWKEASGESKSVDDLPEGTVVGLLRWKLASTACRNQGYVLDGVPVTMSIAEKVFEIAGEGGEEAEGVTEDADADAKAEPADDGAGQGAEDGENAEAKDAGSISKSRSKAILDRLRPTKQVQFPNRVVILHAPLELLQTRAQALSESEAVATGNTQSAFEARHTRFSAEIEALTAFFEQKRVINSVESGVEVLELHLQREEDYSDSDVFLTPMMTYMEQGGGKPHNFHPTREELKQMERDFARKKEEEEHRQKQLELEQEERDFAAQQARLEAERARLELIHREEAELLEARAKPLRTYLMDTVLPALTEGMLEIVKVQPDDPIDYLAEFLFKKGAELEANSS